jgi:hypothetical protein
MLGNFCGRFPPFQISVTILNHCGVTHTLLSGKQGKNIVIVLTDTVNGVPASACRQVKIVPTMYGG